MVWKSNRKRAHSAAGVVTAEILPWSVTSGKREEGGRGGWAGGSGSHFLFQTAKAACWLEVAEWAHMIAKE